MLIVDEFYFGKLVFERKVEHSSPEVLFTLLPLDFVSLLVFYGFVLYPSFGSGWYMLPRRLMALEGMYSLPALVCKNCCFCV